MQVLIKHPPKGLAIKQVRNMFFPYWKSVLSRAVAKLKLAIGVSGPP